MAWPYTPLTTYIPNSVPAIKADDLNALQAQENVLSKAHRDGFTMSDDFTDVAIDTNRWDLVSCSIVDDSANDSMGSAQVDADAGFIRSKYKLSVGTRDFEMSARVRNVASTSAVLIIGLNNLHANDAHACYIGKTAVQTNWHCYFNGNGAGLGVDSGVAAVSASYVDLSIKRVSGVVEFFINGTSVYSSPLTNSLVSKFEFYHVGTTATTFIDLLRLTVAR